MNDLPECVHRGAETSPGFIECASNRLLPLPPAGGAAHRSVETCRRCPYVNRENRTAARRRIAIPAQRPDLTAAEFPCVHRGDVIERRECQLCGSRGKLFDVHACTVHGLCSVQTRQRGLKACVACEEQQPQSHQFA